jgi:hypothetical protein
MDKAKNSSGMFRFIQNNHRLLFFGTWLLLSLLQAGLTELQDDEAYYWVFSKYPAWGYFDHPPMTALLVKAGTALLPGELGVRLFPLLLNFLTVLLLEKLCGRKNPPLFYALALSLAAFQLAGWMASPDASLIFFTALFFLCYKIFTERKNPANSLLLGISMTLLCYSKYQAALVILFTLLSNPQLFRTYHIYLAGSFALLLFMPHLLWQYNHDWVSFRYHLFESNVNPYKISYTTEYLGGQFLLAGPVAGFILLPAAFIYKPGNVTEKALKTCLWGIYIFFLLSSFRGKVEANWTSPVIIPLFVLSHGQLMSNGSGQRWLRKLLPATLMLVMVARGAMIADFIPLKFIRQHFHAWKNWPQQMKKNTKGLPVVFSNSYQRASKYWFYTGQTCYSQNLYKQRLNNFNFWPVEDSLLGKPVYFLDIYGLQRFRDLLETPIGMIGYRFDSSFISFAKIKFIPAKNSYTVTPGQNTRIDFTLQMTDQYRDFVLANKNLQNRIRLGVYSKYGWIADIPTSLNLYQVISEKISSADITAYLPAGNYTFRFAVDDGDYNTTHNSDRIKLKIE